MNLFHEMFAVSYVLLFSLYLFGVKSAYVFENLKWGKCVKDAALRMLVSLSYNQCLDECNRRPACQSVNYDHLLDLCELNLRTLQTLGEVTDCGSFVFKDKEWERVDSHCNMTCNLGQVCKKQNGNMTCVIAECPFPTTESFLGNMNGVGYRIKHKCNSSENHVIRACLENGFWSGGTPVCSRDFLVGKPAFQSSLYLHDGVRFPAGLAVDGNHDSNLFRNSCTHTLNEADDPAPWWKVEFRSTMRIQGVIIYNRDEIGDRLANFVVYVGMEVCTEYTGPANDGEVLNLPCRPVRYGNYLKIQKYTGVVLTLCEVEVY